MDIANQTSGDEIFFFVATSTHNGGQRIKLLLDSMLHQTSTNFVHYIYDDGSQTPADEVIEDYRQKASSLSKPFQVIYEKGPDLGLDLAYGRLFSKRTGTHFFWIDDDDCLDPSFFETLTREIKVHPDCTWFHTDRREFDPSGRLFRKPTSAQCDKKRLREEDQYLNYVSGVNFFYSSLVIQSKAFAKHNPNCLFLDARKNGGFYFDQQVCQVMACSHEKMDYIDAPLFYSCMRPDSSSHVYCGQKPELRDKAKADYLLTLGYPKAEVDSFYEARTIYEKIFEIRFIASSGDLKKTLEWAQEIKAYFKRKDIPPHCRLHLSYVRQAVFAVKHPHLFALRKKAKRLLRH